MRKIRMIANMKWSDKINSNPIDDLRSAQMLVGANSAEYGLEFEMNKNTLSEIGKTNQFQRYIAHLNDKNINNDNFLELMWGYKPDKNSIVKGENSLLINEDIENMCVIVGNRHFPNEKENFYIEYISL